MFEYKVVPAPKKGLKSKGIKGTEARFANALQTVMNEQGADGWEYQRTDTLPVEERQGLTGKSTSFQNMLVFRRVLVAEVEETPEVAALIEDKTEIVAQEDTPDVVEEPVEVTIEEDIAAAAPQKGVEALSLAAQSRVSETLEAPTFFQRRKPADDVVTPKDDDAHHPAE